MVAEHLLSHGYAVEALDLRGHGHSSGPRATVADADEYIEDLDALLLRVRSRNPGSRLFLLGHSMGGGVVLNYLVARRPSLDGVLLSGAGMLNPRPPVDPAAPAPGPLPASTVSRDPAVVAAYESDPLVYRGLPNPHRMQASQRAYDRIQAGMHAIALPLLIMHGTADLLVPYQGSEQLFEVAASNDKTLRLYAGLYHEILNEPERGLVLADMLAWLDARSEPVPE